MLVVALTVVALVPVAVPVVQSFVPGFGRGAPSSISLSGFTLDGWEQLLAPGSITWVWLANSCAVSLSTVVIAVLIGAPAGYVLARSRARVVSVYALVLFVVQTIPMFAILVPLFVFFVKIGLWDNLLSVGVVYVGMSLAFAIWMMSSYIASVPVSLEESAWMDGCSLIGAFFRIVLPNSLPGILSTAVFTFLLVWNDYLVAFIFLRSPANLTLPVGLHGGGAGSVLLMIPPLVVFAVLNRYFSLGGVAGSLADR